MKNRKGYGSLIILLCFFIMVSITVILAVSENNLYKVFTHDFVSTPKVAQKLHQSLNIYIHLDVDNSICKVTDLYIEKRNIKNNCHTVPDNAVNNNFIESMASSSCCSGFEIEGLNVSNMIQIGKNKYVVLCVNSDGTVYTVTNMRDGVDTSIKPLHGDITIKFDSVTQKPLICDISHSGIHKIYKCESNQGW